MSQGNFNLLSLNVRGLRDYKKNIKMFNWIAKHGGDNGVAFIQETHSTQEITDEWSRRTRGKLVMSHGTSKSKGTAILFGSKLHFKTKDQIIDTNGRYVIVWSEIQGKHFLLVNTYFPNLENEQVSLMKEIMEVINKIEYPIDTHMVWGGDFNFIFDQDLEAHGGNPTLKLRSIETMETIMLNFDLCDIWRLRNPEAKRFTWRGKGQGKRSQLIR
ncbi:MAG: hypothetical protein DSY43_01275 [Gammaproteobacteria bacterium]|nr:MAG: hypothetical protein DSY43_01275 [Gammaproteobacteria bacterium]